MGEKEDRLRRLRRKVFERDGWQDDRGNWWAVCGMDGCDQVVPWFGTGLTKVDAAKPRTLDNMVIRCNACGRGVRPGNVKRRRYHAQR